MKINVLGRIASMRALAALLSFAAIASSADLLPLKPGNTWFYRDRESAAGVFMRVGIPPRVHDSRTYYQLDGYAAEPLWVRADRDGSLYYLEEETGRDVLLTSFERGGGWFGAPKRDCLQDGQTQADSVPYDGSAGKFPAVLSVRYRSRSCADAGVEEEQFLENVGMIRRTVQTIAGPVTYDLVQASVGSITIAEQPSASFQISLRRLREGQLVSTLRLASPGSIPIRLTHPTTQEFDVALRDVDGNELWRWSQDKVFRPQLIQRDVLELVYETEIPLRLGVPLSRGTFVVEAWLTTMPKDRQFATSMSFQILEGDLDPLKLGLPARP